MHLLNINTNKSTSMGVQHNCGCGNGFYNDEWILCFIFTSSLRWSPTSEWRKLHIFLATGCQNFFKAGSEHKFCTRSMWPQKRPLTLRSLRGCARWINERMAAYGSRAAFLHRGVGLPVTVDQCALEKSVCKSYPRLLVSCFWLLWGKGRRIFLTILLSGPQSWQDTQTFQSL